MFANVDIFEGGLIDGNRYGQGKCSYADGAVYEGEWLDDKRKGSVHTLMVLSMWVTGKMIIEYMVKESIHGHLVHLCR
ncbi:MAG: hypothetical protein EB127_27580 [Alphaproteobacteria bacterium]|nr:hypothetical protein [Alphaproteobacteria bacterium]